MRIPLPSATPVIPRERRRRRRLRHRVHSAASPAFKPSKPTEPAVWLQPDLESYIPSHTIPVPRLPPTPLDNLLAVAELEFNQQRDEQLLDFDNSTPYPFLLTEEVARDVMSFELTEPKQADEKMYFERIAASERVGEYASEIGYKDLFETINELHYLPELEGPHEEALLESLVEKGCEDNKILGQAVDKLVHLVHGSGEYAEEENILLSNAADSHIIDRLEKTLESPGQSSITAAQGLLHLHHISDHLALDPNQRAEQIYMTEEVFVQKETSQCQVEILQPTIEHQGANEVSFADYCINAEKINENEIGIPNAVYTDPVLDSKEFYGDKKFEEPRFRLPIPDQSEVNTPNGRINNEPPLNDICSRKIEQIEDNFEEDMGEAGLQNVQQHTPHNRDSNDGYDKENSQELSNKDEQPTDLSIKHVAKNVPLFMLANDTDTSHLDDNMSGNDEQPRDLTVQRRLPTPHASPRRTDVSRAPSRESDAMQSPQPSGIPAVPSSPEIFTMPLSKSKQTLFLETILSSPSPKMYTSEVTITKQQCEPLKLGKLRKSASPTVSSCSDEMKKLNKAFGEPQKKIIKRESKVDLAKMSKVIRKCREEPISKKPEKLHVQTCDESTPQQQFQLLKLSPEFHIPDPLLVPKDKLNSILAAPGKEIPALLLQRPELRLPEAFAYPAVLQNPDILVISLSQLESIIENEEKNLISPKSKEKESKRISSSKTYTRTKQPSTPQPDHTSQPKSIPSMDALAGDIDAATSAALNQMLWLPYLSQLEAIAACSQNMDFLKSLNSSGYNGPNNPDLSQMFNPSARFMGPGGFPMMPSMDYDNRLHFAMWQEAMSHSNASSSQRPKRTTMADQMKELSKSTDVQNPTKNHPNKLNSSVRTSPIAHNYNNQRSQDHNPFLQNIYPGTNSNMRPNMLIPGLQIPYFNPKMTHNQRSPRTGQRQSTNSPYYPNNNYLQTVNQSESQCHPQTPTTQESTRPRISVKSLHNLLEPSAAAASGIGSSRRTPSTPMSALGRRREEPEVGSTTPLGESPDMTPQPHDPSSSHLWHPLFGK